MASEVPPRLNEESGGAPVPSPRVPPILGARPSVESPAATAFQQGRLHPLTLVFAGWNVARGLIIPAIFLLVFGRERLMAVFLLLFVAVPITVAVVRYLTFTFRIENGELITRQGLIGRRERNIPLARVQDIRVEQGVLHRMLGMADVNVETAGGEGAEASLSVLSLVDAERLREAVFARSPMAGAGGEETVPPRPAPEVIRRLSVGELVRAGLTSNQMASAMAIVLVGFGLLDDILPRDTYERIVTENVERMMSEGAATSWGKIAVGAGLLVLTGMAFSVAGSVIMFYGFALSRSGEDLHRSYGLLTRRATSLPRRRIQVLKIEETLLRRFFGLAALRADTAGSRESQSPERSGGRDWLLPVVPRAEVEPLLPVFFPDLEGGEADWRHVSRRAIVRGTVKGSVVCALVAAVSLGVGGGWMDLWPLLFIPGVYALNVMSYRHLGYWQSDRFFRTRRGWLSRATHIVPIRNVQSLVVRQTPFDRRHRVGTLMVDTAGQVFTGGGPRIDNVPFEESLALARGLAQQAARTRYRW